MQPPKHMHDPSVLLLLPAKRLLLSGTQEAALQDFFCAGRKLLLSRFKCLINEDLINSAAGSARVSPGESTRVLIRVFTHTSGRTGYIRSCLGHRPMFPPGECLQQPVKYLTEKVTGISAPRSKLVPCLQPVCCHTLAEDCLFSPGQPKVQAIRVLSVCTQTQPSYMTVITEEWTWISHL